MKNGKKNPAAALFLNLIPGVLLFAVSVIILAYVMTKKDMPPSSYKLVYVCIGGITAFLIAFLTVKHARIKPIIAFFAAFAVSLALSVVPVIAVSGSAVGLSALLIPGINLPAAFAGTALGRKI